jgi:hypothetical protein
MSQIGFSNKDTYKFLIEHLVFFARRPRAILEKYITLTGPSLHLVFFS